MGENTYDWFEARRPELRGRFDLPASRLGLGLMRAVIHYSVDLIQLSSLVIEASEGASLQLTAFD